MENLSPAAQVAAIVMGGICFVALWISVSDSWGKIFGRKR